MFNSSFINHLRDSIYKEKKRILCNLDDLLLLGSYLIQIRQFLLYTFTTFNF